jgi:glutamate-5-semialdehyde dehydrogenase
MDIQSYMYTVGRAARVAARELARAETRAKDLALETIAEAIERNAGTLLQANARDLEAAKTRELEAALVDRLTLNDSRITSMADGLRQIAQLPDPVGEISDVRYRPTGIQVGHMRVPLGVIGIIYESRPNVIVPEGRQCGDSSRRFGSDSLEQGNRRLRARGIARRRPARTCSTSG